MTSRKHKSTEPALSGLEAFDAAIAAPDGIDPPDETPDKIPLEAFDTATPDKTPLPPLGEIGLTTVSDVPALKTYSVYAPRTRLPALEVSAFTPEEAIKSYMAQKGIWSLPSPAIATLVGVVPGPTTIE